MKSDSANKQTLIKYIGKQLRNLRVSYKDGRGLSQEALAREIGVNFGTISRWETGSYSPSVGNLESVARFFGVSILVFFPAEEEPANNQFTILLNIAKQLPPEDLEELTKYARFRMQTPTGKLKTKIQKPKVKKNAIQEVKLEN